MFYDVVVSGWYVVGVMWGVLKGVDFYVDMSVIILFKLMVNM